MTGRETVCLPVFLRTLPFGGRAGKGSKGRPMPRLAASALQGEGVCEASGRGRSRAGRIRCLPAPEGWGGLMASHLGNGGGGGLEPLCQSVISCTSGAVMSWPRHECLGGRRTAREPRERAVGRRTELALCLRFVPWAEALGFACLCEIGRCVSVRACVRDASGSFRIDQSPHHTRLHVARKADALTPPTSVNGHLFLRPLRVSGHPHTGRSALSFHLRFPVFGALHVTPDGDASPRQRKWHSPAEGASRCQ